MADYIVGISSLHYRNNYLRQYRLLSFTVYRTKTHFAYTYIICDQPVGGHDRWTYHTHVYSYRLLFQVAFFPGRERIARSPTVLLESTQSASCDYV